MRKLVRAALMVFAGLAGLVVLAVAAIAAGTMRDPTEVRLSLGSSGEYEADWATHEPLAPLFGTSNLVTLDGNASRSGGDHTEYLRSDSFPWLVGLTTHRAPLGPLAPGSHHAYRLPRGPDRPFRVASRESLRIVVLGDTGLNEHDETFAHRAAAAQPDLILHVGDLAYAFGDEGKWEAWMAALEPASETAPFMPVPGNHEKEYGESYRNYDARFAWGGVHHQSYDLGPAHVVHLDSEDMDADQDAWLANDLDHVDRAKTPWVIALLHRPLYSSGALHTSSKPAREHFEKLFDAYHVDLVLAGHEHNYERTYPVIDGRVNDSGPGPYHARDGPMYVVTGGGGATLYPDFLTTPSWSATRAAQHEMLILDLTGNSLNGMAVREDGSTLDSFSLTMTPP